MIDTDGDTVPQIEYYTEGGVPRAFIGEDSKVSLVVRLNDTSSTNVDTLIRVDMQPTGELVNYVKPYAHEVVDSWRNFYLPHTGSGIEQVPGYDRIVYANIYPYIDEHFYHTPSGRQMALVVRPGGSPATIQLHFSGQDSLHVDLWGMLRVYFRGRYFVLPQAIAYQVTSGGAVVPLSWAPQYNATTGNVTFTVGSYVSSLPLVFQFGPAPAAGGGGGDDWRTLLGTNNIAGGDAWINASASEPGGDLFVAGTTLDQAFPANTGAVGHAGQLDVFYGRFDYAPGDPDHDAARKWMTYFGGSGKDVPIVAHFASDDRLYIAGWTDSEDIIPNPASDPADGTFWQGVNKGETDGFIIQTDTSAGAVLRWTYLGGAGKDMITAVTEDAFGDLYLAGASTTTSGSYGTNCTSPITGFPLCDPGSGAYQQTSNAGGTDAFVTKIDPDFYMGWSTFYGGSGNNYIYDAAYWSEPVGVQDRVILVGSSNGAVPFVDSAEFHLGGLSDSTGFIVTFDRSGHLKWETNIHGTTRLEAAAIHQDRLVVMGTTPEILGGAPAITTAGCNAVPGYLSICDPGGSAYTQTEVRLKDEYFAEFEMPDAQMIWSTTYGGWTWEAADYTVELPEAHYQTHPFPIHRFGDLVFDGDGNLLTLGIIEQSSYPAVADTVSYPTLGAYGFYQKAWEDTMGNNQTEVSLKCFLADRSLYWSTTFGAWFTHRTPDPWEDQTWLPLGCDWATDLDLVEGKALYWVGSSGGVDFDDACPYPGTSWCEPTLAFGSDLDFSNGFTARMNMDGVHVGIMEHPAPISATGAWCYPDPVDQQLTLVIEGHIASQRAVRVFDAIGRLVLAATTTTTGQLRTDMLNTGCYQLVVLKDGSPEVAIRFIKQH